MTFTKLIIQVAVTAIVSLQGLAFALGTTTAPTVHVVEPASGFNAPTVAVSFRRSAAEACASIAVPPAYIATQSKYRTADVSRSQLDQDAVASRDEVMRPIRLSIQQLADMAFGTAVDARAQPDGMACGVATLVRWAEAGSLTSAGSEDFALNRSRMIAEIALSLLELERRAAIEPAQHELIASWLSSIGQSTMVFFEQDAGPRSRVNNHRYWAALALTAIGMYTERADFVEWGKKSWSIGACQVQANGTLPLELERAGMARNYHLYALRPLAVTAQLLSAKGALSSLDCVDGLARLAATSLRGAGDDALFSALTGERQVALPTESTYAMPLRLTSRAFEMARSGTLIAGL